MSLPNASAASELRVTFISNETSELLALSPTSPAREICDLLAAIFGVPGPMQRWAVLDGRGGARVVFTNDEGSASRTVSEVFLGVDVSSNVIMVLPPSASSAASAPAAAARARRGPRKQTAPLFRDGWGVMDVLHFNPDPKFAVAVIRTHDRLLRELNHHNPELAALIRDPTKNHEAVAAVRSMILSRTAESVLSNLAKADHERTMSNRLQNNPDDTEARDALEKIQNEELIARQYETMMEDFPEAMGRVLMLYVSVQLNGHTIQAFVDSGAQVSVLTMACARRCGLDKIIDGRFASMLVGVGTRASLGRVHIAPLSFGGRVYPVSLTVQAEVEKDTAPELILGLDMLKRHGICLDLHQHCLRFPAESGGVTVPFLHEKDLPVSKGGTLGFNPETMDELEDQAEDLLPSSSSAAAETTAAATPNSSRAAGNEAVSPTPTATAAVSANENDVQDLVSMGFQEDKVRETLDSVGGDKETALTLLLFSRSSD